MKTESPEKRIITPENIRAAEDIYGKHLPNWKLARKTITKYFEDHPSNDDPNIVLTKVVLVDSLYRTNLYYPIQVARYIYKNHDILDNLIRDQSPKAVNIIRKCKESVDKKDAVSFASKYCHFHDKDKYPIYDQYVNFALSKLNGQWDASKKHIRYSDFLDEIMRFKNVGNLEKIDTFLWLYGMRDILKKQGKKAKVNREVSDLYDQEQGKAFFEALG